MTTIETKPVKVQCITHNVALGEQYDIARDKESLRDDELNKGDAAELPADLAKYLIDRDQVKRV
ncbi:hypothetical protein [Sphingobium sp. YR768]|uniref:hypothetical protein n=1 Tax=Sphingobium sp. YR768 TaxID=1884365 RepID=UPI0008B5FCCD|nr:hypothetical protein [Sphingobium sp. YR768]SES08455.1 hypothetical protein SAMN05518866_13734 [Sphingobium sp. YR768]